MKELLEKYLKKLKAYQYKKLNYRFIIFVCGLTILGINVIGSASIGSNNMQMQILGFAMGLVAMFVLMFIDYHFVFKFYWLIYALTAFLLVLVRLRGSTGGGAMRWLSIGGFRLQPSEFAKIFLIIFFAKLIMKHKEKLNTFRMIALCVILVAIPMGLIFMQPDLSTTILMILLFCAIMYIAGISYKIIGVALGIAAVAGGVLLFLIMQPDQEILRGYQLNRIIAFYDEDSEYSDDLLYQQENSVIAIGSGGLWGKGLYNDDANSIKNGNYLYAAHTDFIYAIVGEELGFIGSIGVILLLFLIIIECFNVGIHSPDLGGKIFACSYGALIGFQSLINLAVATMLIPNTGLTLPFVSYGLSSLLSLFIGAGIVLNISLQQKKLL